MKEKQPEVPWPSKQPDEVLITQYLRPNGLRQELYAPVGRTHANMAKDMLLSSEVLTTGQLALYARFTDQEPEQELIQFATNGPGPHSPTEVLKKLIETLYLTRSATEPNVNPSEHKSKSIPPETPYWNQDDHRRNEG